MELASKSDLIQYYPSAADLHCSRFPRLKPALRSSDQVKPDCARLHLPSTVTSSGRLRTHEGRQARCGWKPRTSLPTPVQTRARSVHPCQSPS